MASRTATYDLAPTMRAEECGALDAFLRSHADAPVLINCSATVRMGGHAAQVLAAHHKARDDHSKLALEGVTADLAGMIDRLGMNDLLPKIHGAS